MLILYLNYIRYIICYECLTMFGILFLILSTLPESLTECPRDWIINTKLGKCYSPLNESANLTWGNARRYCQDNYGADLPCLEDDEEIDFLQDILWNHTFADYIDFEKMVLWLGASDKQKEGVWKCVEGEVIDPETFGWRYDRLTPNSSNLRDCLQLTIEGLHDAKSTSTAYFTCTIKDTSRRERTIYPDTAETMKPTTPNQTTTAVNRKIYNNNTTPTLHLSTQHSIQANVSKTYQYTHVIIVLVIIVVMMVLFMVLSLIFFILYVRQRRKSEHNTTLYDRPLPQPRQEHVYQSYQTSCIPESDGIYDQPNDPMKIINAATRTRTNRHVEKQNGDSAYVDVRIPDNDYI